jgi:hypothetical protein
MVAASGSTEGLRPVVAWLVPAGVIVSVTAAILMGAQTMLFRRVPLEKPPEALAERARDILLSVGYSEPPVDTAMGFYEGNDFLSYIGWINTAPLARIYPFGWQGASATVGNMKSPTRLEVGANTGVVEVSGVLHLESVP